MFDKGKKEERPMPKGSNDNSKKMPYPNPIPPISKPSPDKGKK